jgi:hypothetical protein
MVPMAGIGPATSPLPRECSTTEPHGPFTSTTEQALFTGAGDEARTRDIQFGKLKLYQLSYTRVAKPVLPTTLCLLAHLANSSQQTLLTLLLYFGGGGWIRTSVL